MAEAAVRAGVVFRDQYELALKSMNPEDAADVAFDAVGRYLENIGATRPVEWTEGYPVSRVEVTNAEEFAETIVRVFRKEQKA